MGKGYKWGSCIFSQRLAIGQILELFNAEDLKIQILILHEALKTGLFFFSFYPRYLMLSRQYVLNLKIQNLLLCAGSPLNQGNCKFRSFCQKTAEHVRIKKVFQRYIKLLSSTHDTYIYVLLKVEYGIIETNVRLRLKK